MTVAFDVAAELSALHGLCFDQGWPPEAFVTLCAQPNTVVLRADEHPSAAFVLYRWTADEAELITLCVSPDLRRRGLAQGLLANMNNRLRKAGVRCVHLEVRADNEAALCLYCADGYVRRGQRPGYYRIKDKRIDAVLMTKDL